MLTQLKRLFGGGNRTSKQRSAHATAPRAGFTPAPSHSYDATQPEPPAAKSTSSSATTRINDEDVSIPLQSVLNALPPNLKSRVVPLDLGGATLTVTLQKVLPQLPFGVVKLSFGVLRSAAPQLFSVGKEFDQQDIELPLHELLTRIHPSLLPRPTNQRPANLMDSIEDSFIVPAATSPTAQPISKPTSPAPIRVPFPTNISATKASAAPNPAFTAKPAASPGRETIVVPLASLAAVWPPEIRSEIAQLKCAGAQVVLPEQLVKVGMKQGKVAFPWQTIRGWINPAPAATVSKHDSTALTLPLEVLMPLFVARLKQSPKSQSRLVVDETIPPLFGPATPAESPLTESTKGLNQPSAEMPAESSSSPDSSAAKPKTPGTDFKNRYLSPSEAVTRANALTDVAGALVVLPEGLLVAAQISTEQNPDALAAFLARALGRVDKCAEEAHLGELSQLEFIAQNVPWKIFRLHGVLFAAFGRANGTLPHQQLAAIAGEFDRKKRG